MAKTIILHSCDVENCDVENCDVENCDVENCEDTSATIVERGEIQRKGRMYCLTGASNDVSYKNNTHIPSISITTF